MQVAGYFFRFADKTSCMMIKVIAPIAPSRNSTHSICGPLSFGHVGHLGRGMGHSGHLRGIALLVSSSSTSSTSVSNAGFAPATSVIFIVSARNELKAKPNP